MLEVIKISGADNGGEFGMMEVTVRAGEGSPGTPTPRRTSGSTCSRASSRSMSVIERLSLTPGSFAFGPRGVPHTFIAETDGARALVGFQPFLFEGFLREVGVPAAERVLPPPLAAPPDMARLHPIGVRSGMEILGPPGPPPGH